MNEPRRLNHFLAGARATIPLVIGAIPFGIIFGTLAAPSGLSDGGALAMSSIVFAGSSQFIALGLLSGGAGLAIIVFTTFIVNLRHLLYAAALVDEVKHLPQSWRVPLAFWLTDETFAAVSDHYRRLDPDDQTEKAVAHWFYFGSAVAMYGNWQLCTVIGLVLGGQVPGIDEWGLEFAMSAAFIGIVTPYLAGVLKPDNPEQAARARAMWICVITAGTMAVIAHDLPHKLGIMIAAASGISAGYLALTLSRRARTSPHV